MSDATGIFLAISALVGFILFSVVGATLFLFLLGFVCVTADYLLGKALKPSPRSAVFLQTSEECNRGGNNTNYAERIKEYAHRFKERCRCLKVAERVAISDGGDNSHFTDDRKKHASNLPNRGFQNMVDPPIEDASEHSGTNVSQVNESRQPKPNGTER